MPNIRRVVARNQARNQERTQQATPFVEQPRVAYLNQQQAENVLVMYCDENEIDIDRLPNENIDLFLNEIRYAHSDISNRTIANECGITVENYIQESPRITFDVDSDSGLDFDQWYTTVMNSGNRNSQPINYAEIANSLRAEAVEPATSYESVSQFYTYPSPDVARAVAKKKKPQRSEREMMMEIVRGEEFPKPDFKDWSSSRELHDIVNDWFRHVEYREHWIFARREREGFNRRNIGMFNLDDVMSRMTKRKNGHPLDTEKSKFYDWKLGGTDWTLRLELYQHEQYYFLISRYIHKPTNIEIKYDVRYWNGDSFKVINTLISNERGHKAQFESAFGSNEPNSDFYVEPCSEEEVDSYFSYSNISDWEDD